MVAPGGLAHELVEVRAGRRIEHLRDLAPPLEPVVDLERELDPVDHALHVALVGLIALLEVLEVDLRRLEGIFRLQLHVARGIVGMPLQHAPGEPVLGRDAGPGVPIS
jgi:hypothetical protein